MSWHSRDWRMHRLVPEDQKTEVFVALCRLMGRWREDPERLAVAVTAYEGLGYVMAGFEIEHSDSPAGDRTDVWPQDKAIDVVNASLRGRPKRILRARAIGLVMALADTAADVNRALLHDVQVDVAVIECRTLSRDERVARLRAAEGDQQT